MSLNWKEIQLILNEVNLVGCKIQNVIQNDFHSLTWEMYGKDQGQFLFYTEVGTPDARLHTLSQNKKLEKTKKLQRFIQFTRKNVDGCVIKEVRQLPYDRCVIWKCDNHGRVMNIVIRLYSGPGANIIVTDENFKILDLLLRRPGRDEISNSILNLEERTSEDKKFEIRPYEGSFNEFIERTCSEHKTEDTYEALRTQVEQRRDRELARITSSIKSAEKTLNSCSDYEELKYTADLLSSNAYLFKKGDASVSIHDYAKDSVVVISLDKSLNPGDNVKHYYDKYQKAKGAFQNAKDELNRLNEEYQTVENRFSKALEQSEDREECIKRMKNILEKTQTSEAVHQGPGLRCTSGGFDILIGRNAKENDELLRHYAKGNDTWLHVRDYPGGYVFIKFKRNKTVPLDVLLDAANLAVLFSKGRNQSQVNLYYTEVRFLRRAKDSKTGLVLPTQEKNLTIKLDMARIQKLLPDKDAYNEE